MEFIWWMYFVIFGVCFGIWWLLGLIIDHKVNLMVEYEVMMMYLTLGSAAAFILGCVGYTVAWMIW